MAKRRRLLRILLLPILAPIFMIGWLLTFAGESRTSKKQVLKRNIQGTQKNEEVKMGVLDQLEEEVTHLNRRRR